MAELKAKVTLDLDWLPSDRLELWVGTEDASDLATSTPAGGTLVFDGTPWPGSSGGDATRGGLGADPLSTEPLGFSSVGYGLAEGELGFGALGINDMPRRVLEHRYTATDKCACLPVGVTVTDDPGNQSPVLETLVQLRDAPVGARVPALAATANPLEVLVSWVASPDL